MPFNPADAEKSIRGFEKFTAPTLCHALDAVIVKSMERHSTELEKDLDFKCIDGVIVTANGWTIPFASRVQFKNYSAFSVRRTRPSGEPTEHAKLSQAQRLQKPMPRYHVQTFVDADEQSAIVGIAETVDLLKYIDKHQNQWRTAPSGETFFYIPFTEIDCKVYRVDDAGHVKDVTNLYRQKNKPLS